MHTFPKATMRTVLSVALLLVLVCSPFSKAEAPANFIQSAEHLTDEEYGALRQEIGEDIQGALEQRVADDSAVFEDSMETAGLGFVNGVPDADAIAWYDALSIAVDALSEEYGMSDADLDQFTAVFSYNVADPEQPLWQVDLMPTDASRQLELGVYGAHIFAKTGEIRNLHSQEDSVG